MKYFPISTPLKTNFLNFSDINNDGIIDFIAGVLNQKSETSKENLKVFYGSKIQNRIYFTKMNIIPAYESKSTPDLIR